MNMTPDNRPTPITDAAEFSLGDDGAFSKMVVESGVSRTLERRLAEMRGALEEILLNTDTIMPESREVRRIVKNALRKDDEAGKGNNAS